MQPPIALQEHDTVRAAYDLMMSSGLRELPVVDAGRRVVGLVNEVAIAHAYLQARHTARAPRA
jgi:CBS domain-containing protein